MTHRIREKKKPPTRVRRLRGHVKATERALEREAGCALVMHLTAALGMWRWCCW